MSERRFIRLMPVRKRPLLRDWRVFTGLRLLGALSFVLADHGLDLEESSRSSCWCRSELA